MKQKPRSLQKRKHPKTHLRLPDLEDSKTAVLNSLSSVDGQRGYGLAIDEFVDWYCSEPRLALNRTVVLRYRTYLDRAAGRAVRIDDVLSCESKRALMFEFLPDHWQTADYGSTA